MMRGQAPKYFFLEPPLGKSRLVKKKPKVGVLYVVLFVVSKKINEEELQELFPEGVCILKF